MNKQREEDGKYVKKVIKNESMKKYVSKKCNWIKSVKNQVKDEYKYERKMD